MASPVGATSSNHAEQIRLLQTQADKAFAQQQAAEKTVASFADHIKNNQTPENIDRLQELLTKTQEATGYATELRRKVLVAELTYYNPKNQCVAQGASLANQHVVELNLEEPLGYFPE